MIPAGYISFERKVLALEHGTFSFPYPKENFWSQSSISLCPFKVSNSGLIEDQSSEAIEVDFANKYLGGGALRRGCVQVFLFLNIFSVLFFDIFVVLIN